MRGRITDLLADPYNPSSLSGRARLRRWQWVVETFPGLGEMRVIDLGGRPENWETAPVLPREVVLLNVEPMAEPAAERITTVRGDALDPPDLGPFDLVYSNSVIEHVGGYVQRRRFADAVERLAPNHWVQTPYRYFPLEPHWLFPGFQFLPLPAKAALSRRWPLGLFEPQDVATAIRESLEIELLSMTEMGHLFPTSEIRAEKALGLHKSLIAVRRRLPGEGADPRPDCNEPGSAGSLGERGNRATGQRCP